MDEWAAVLEGAPVWGLAAGPLGDAGKVGALVVGAVADRSVALPHPAATASARGQLPSRQFEAG